MMWYATDVSTSTSYIHCVHRRPRRNSFLILNIESPRHAKSQQQCYNDPSCYHVPQGPRRCMSFQADCSAIQMPSHNSNSKTYLPDLLLMISLSIRMSLSSSHNINHIPRFYVQLTFSQWWAFQRIVCQWLQSLSVMILQPSTGIIPTLGDDRAKHCTAFHAVWFHKYISGLFRLLQFSNSSTWRPCYSLPYGYTCAHNLLQKTLHEVSTSL